nr:hypothetical protein [Microbacterium lemovicicum]
MSNATEVGTRIGSAVAICLEIGDALPDEDELIDAVSRRRGVFVYGFENRELDLSFLDPVIESLTFLKIDNYGPVVNAGILTRASALKALHIGPRVRGQDSGATFPALEVFEGTISAAVAGITRSEVIRDVFAVGQISPKAGPFQGPVKTFTHLGYPKQTELPRFAHPDALLDVTRSRVHEFDARDLLRFTALQRLRVEMCPNLNHLSALGEITTLKDVVFHTSAVSDGEGWESVPTRIPKVWFMSPKAPWPSRQWTFSAEERGWSVHEFTYHLEQAYKSQKVFEVFEPEDTDLPWEVRSTDFSWLDDVIEEGASGHDVEAILKGDLYRDTSGDYDTAVFDSEADQFIVQLPTRALANRFAKQATHFISTTKALEAAAKIPR